MSSKVVVIMPVHQRAEQTVETFRRLRQTAQYDASYWAVSGQESKEVVARCAEQSQISGMIAQVDRLTYWQALDLVTRSMPDEMLVATVANDVLPCWRWLLLAVNAFDEYGGIVGFNGDGHDASHACHFLTDMKTIRHFGGWPMWYFHNFGDTELITRARAENKFMKHPWSILFHNHPVLGQKSDAQYDDANANQKRDAELFEYRRKHGWTSPT